MKLTKEAHEAWGLFLQEKMATMTDASPTSTKGTIISSQGMP